jgi:shikimate kinase
MSELSHTTAAPAAPLPNTDCISLVGLTGAGKSTIGKLLAKRLGREFVDSDHEIEARTGVTIREIFTVEGEAGFRDREQAMICALVQRKGIVLATGGGGVLRATTREQLRRHSTVVYLYAAPEEVAKRIGHDKSRPILDGQDPLTRMRELYGQRDGLYREVAHHIAPTHGRSPQAAAAIVQWLQTLGVHALHAEPEHSCQDC